jgi:hypothetical protein
MFGSKPGSAHAYNWFVYHDATGDHLNFIEPQNGQWDREYYVNLRTAFFTVHSMQVLTKAPIDNAWGYNAYFGVF